MTEDSVVTAARNVRYRVIIAAYRKGATIDQLLDVTDFTRAEIEKALSWGRGKKAARIGQRRQFATPQRTGPKRKLIKAAGC